MAKFKVGDRVVMNKKANDKYSITKEGSYGTVVEVYRDSCRVMFDKFKAYGKFISRLPDTFNVSISCLSFFEPTEDDGKTDLERKINMMFKRQPYYEHKVMV